MCSVSTTTWGRTARHADTAPAMWRRFVKPAWRRVLAAVRTRFPHVRFFLHCCGKIEAIVPDIVDLGVHVATSASAGVHGFRSHLPAIWLADRPGRHHFSPIHVPFRHAGGCSPGSGPAGGDSRCRPAGDFHAVQSYPTGNALGERLGFCRVMSTVAGQHSSTHRLTPALFAADSICN